MSPLLPVLFGALAIGYFAGGGSRRECICIHPSSSNDEDIKELRKEVADNRKITEEIYAKVDALANSRN